MDKRKKFGGEDYTGDSTWPKGLRNPAADPMSGPMTKAPKGSQKSGPIGESIKYAIGGATWTVSRAAELSRKLAESMVQGHRSPRGKTK